MDDVISMAEKLGTAIAQSPQALGLREARKAMQAQPDLVKLLDDYQAQTDKVAALEEQQKPVEVDDKRKLQDLHDRLVSSDVFKKYTAAQVEYVDMMRRVNHILRKHLTEVEAE